jgi:hypothetical protein
MTDGANRRVRGRWAFALVAALALLIVAAACSPPRTECDYAAFADTMVGRLVARHGSTATFLIESVTPVASGPGVGSAPALAARHRVSVHYFGDQAQYLRVGRRYAVNMWWLSNQFESGVHVANDACSTGTVNANGSAINTSIWLVSWVRAAAVLVPVSVVLLAVAGAAWAIRRRRRPPVANLHI